MTSPFTRFFRNATNGRDPYPYQERFATADEWPHLLRAPTGAGKTATAVLGWLFRWTEQVPHTPRRLVYCLPMRVLVEQSFGETLRWLHQLGLLDAHADFDPNKPDQVRRYRPRLDDSTADKIAVHRLMGGIETEEWYLHPERSAVLIGTQDMLLSRALNRGYAASRFHWPIDFGLLNNDCQWVFDEPQLMGSGVSTSAQLAGFRHREGLGTFGPCPSVWMSATLEPGWLDTIDFRGKFTCPPIELGKDRYGDDYDPEKPLYKRMTAAKTLTSLGVRVTKEADEKEATAVAKKVLEKHQTGTQTLVVLNTVKRAKVVYQALEKLGHPEGKLLLVHSRFRPYEREGTPDNPGLNARLQQIGEATKNRIIVATQVVEAGVDISARTLVTELAPWASIVQRIGRCNRTGDDGSRHDPARVFWIDVEDKQARPYSEADMAFARGHVAALGGQSVSPKALGDYKLRKEQEAPGEPFLRFTHTHVLRRRDLLGLFDTSPDLSGNDKDVKHYVRGDDPDLDVKVFWRQWEADQPPANEPRPRRVELCNVPIGQLRLFLTGDTAGFAWDHLEREWARLNPQQLRPGLTVLLSASAGGYHELLGWTGDPDDRIPPVFEDDGNSLPEEATESDQNSETIISRTVAAHTDSVCRVVERIVRELPALSPSDQDHLRKAARWHDAGKGHWVFQKAVRRVNPTLPEGEMWAKSGKRGRLRYDRERRRFRHELASALAVLRHRPDWPFVVAYLIAAHHGKVRLSIRSLPGEKPPDRDRMDKVQARVAREALYALGVWDLDELPDVQLGECEVCSRLELDLSPMLLGGESNWTASALRLLREIGPFRLGYLEAIFRAADQWVSNQEREGREP